MGNINYEKLLVELVKPLVTHPEDIHVTVNADSEKAILVNVLVNKDDIGRVIGKKGRVASAIRTIANAAAVRQKDLIEIEFDSLENLND